MPGCSDRSCDHHKCVFYMAESLRYGGFTGARCDDFSAALVGRCQGPDSLKMGGTKPKTGSSGIFHLDTNAESPLSKF
ncbi:unnamed protein product [Arctia plantaginis]|uniref:Uncharacterized protein n=1 Tax=Arctia plantaginis TaxID=874455 RepID=A0A8S1BFW8_ARCPL|nr:unnamed protein product [Arctia plantaginis]